MSDYALALDVGGTFTDVIMLDKTSGQLWTTKTPSTPDDPAQGFFHGVDKIVALATIDPARLQRVFHGSTVATSSILEGKGARPGLIVTNGFNYVREIGGHDIPRQGSRDAWV
jgi:N-methylhydantoinase A